LAPIATCDLESIELRIVFEDADERGDLGCQSLSPDSVAALYGARTASACTNMLDLDVVLRDRLDETSLVLKPRAGGPVAWTGGRRVSTGGGGRRSAGRFRELSRSDPFGPSIMVEEGKHASAPDRNGDGA
jgi:hypothetical protein